VLQGQCNGHDAVGAIESGRGVAQSRGGARLGGLDLQGQDGDQHLDVLHLRFLSLSASGQSAGGPVN
jgi:hypothetical protein